jgi:plastocyanin
MKGGVILFLLWVPCAAAATVTGNAVLINADGTAVKMSDNAGVVVWLDPVGTAPPSASSGKSVTMNQRNQTFLPHVLAVQVGTAVDFPNSDPIFHNAFSNFDGQVFDLQLYAPKTSRRVVFRRPGMVHVFCNVHENMSAVVAVLPTPYFTVTGADGRFQIQAPAGNYRVQIWHERGQPESLTLAEQRITLASEDVRLPEIRIRRSADELPHNNKYGQPYFAVPDAHTYYPGGRH